MKGLSSIALGMQFNIGGITNKKIEQLGKKLGHKYPTMQNLTPTTVYVFSQDMKKYININNEIVSIGSYDNEILDQNVINEITEDLKALLDSFLLDDELINVSIKLINVNNVEVNTMPLLKGFNTLFDEDDTDNLEGVGFRYLLKNHLNGYDEVKVEPFISDSKYLYIEGVNNCGNIHNNSLSEILSNKTKLFETQIAKIYTKLNL